MARKNKQADIEKINEEEKEILNSMKQNLGTFAQLLEEEQTGGRKVMSLKENKRRRKKIRNSGMHKYGFFDNWCFRLRKWMSWQINW